MVVNEFVRRAEPVASEVIAHRVRRYGYSSATIRAELASLDEEGYLEQPYTSAGRVPTDKGYRYYVDELITDTALPPREQEYLARGLEESRPPAKQISELLAELTHHLAVVSSWKEATLYSAGLPHLFEEPELENRDLAHTIARLYEDLDEYASGLFPSIAKSEVRVFIGRENPLGAQELSLLISRYHTPSHTGAVALIGLKRMPYRHSVAVLKNVINYLKDTYD